jgi:hypothetical protein
MKTRLALLALLVPACVRADVADDIKRQLTPFVVLRGEFQQVKTIKIIKKPLRSSGDFVVAKGKGVLWSTTRPMVSTLKVSAEEVAQIKDGKAVFRLKAEEQPGLRLITRVLFAVFAADVAELKRSFDISGSVTKGRWQADLKPRDAMVAKVVSSVRLEGGASVEDIEIQEANGDRTVIRFSAMRRVAALSPAEDSLLE